MWGLRAVGAGRRPSAFDLIGLDGHVHGLIRKVEMVPLDTKLLRPLHGLLVLTAACR